jgi:hypothetical protein
MAVTPVFERRPAHRIRPIGELHTFLSPQLRATAKAAAAILTMVGCNRPSFAMMFQEKASFAKDQGLCGLLVAGRRLAVIGQQQQAFAVGVQAPGHVHARG